MDRVGIPDAATGFDDYPHHTLLRGSVQRAIERQWRWRASRESLADWLTEAHQTALDVTSRPQILELFVRFSPLEGRRNRKMGCCYVTQTSASFCRICDL